VDGFCGQQKYAIALHDPWRSATSGGRPRARHKGTAAATRVVAARRTAVIANVTASNGSMPNNKARKEVVRKQEAMRPETSPVPAAIVILFSTRIVT
jgi:hypothetical protein